MPPASGRDAGTCCAVCGLDLTYRTILFAKQKS